MIGSWFDVLLVFMLVSSIGVGFHQGLVRQAFVLMAIYTATVLSAQSYGYLSAMLIRTFPTSSLEVTDLIAFVMLLFAFTVLVTWFIWSSYQVTRLPTALMLDNMTGAVLGSVIGLFAIALTVVLTQYAVQAPWPDGSPVKYALRVGLNNSALEDLFATPLPIMEAALRPWLPSNIPFMPNT